VHGLFLFLLVFIKYLLLFITLEGEGEHGFIIYLFIIIMTLKGERGARVFCSFFVNFFFSFVSFLFFF
jgi:hypothetical protein